MKEWGIYPWFRENGTDLVHPEDLEAFALLQPYGKVFFYFKKSNDYIFLKYQNNIFRVKPTLFKTIPTPIFNFDQEVETVSSKNSDIKYKGKIYDIFWHTQKKQHMFFLKIGEKRKSKRYWAKNLKEI